MFKITITCAFLMALASVHAFLPMPCRMPTNMKVGQSSSTGRSKSIGIINSMRENIEGEANPTQVCLVFGRGWMVGREKRGRARHTVRKSRLDVVGSGETVSFPPGLEYVCSVVWYHHPLHLYLT